MSPSEFKVDDLGDCPSDALQQPRDQVDAIDEIGSSFLIQKAWREQSKAEPHHQPHRHVETLAERGGEKSTANDESENKTDPSRKHVAGTHDSVIVFHKYPQYYYLRCRSAVTTASQWNARSTTCLSSLVSR